MSSLVGEEVELIDSMWRRAEESSLYPWREEILMLALCIAKSWCSWRMGREKINADWMFLVQKYGQSCTLTICQSFQPYDATCKELLLCCLPLEICWPDVYVPERLGQSRHQENKNMWTMELVRCGEENIFTWKIRTAFSILLPNLLQYFSN